MDKCIVSTRMGLTACSGGTETDSSDTSSVESSASESEENGEENASSDLEDVHTDIIVVGSGLAGASTAITALENGADVILVDKAASFGIGFLSSRGNMMNAMIEENKEAHLIESDDTLEEALSRWETMSQIGNNQNLDLVDYDRVETMLIESAYSVQWMIDQGIEMEPSFTKEERGQDIAKIVKQGDEAEGLTAMKQLQKNFEDLGGDLRLKTEATSLIVEDGVVKGVVVEGEEGSYNIYADNVVLATGGFGGNEDLLLEAIPALDSLGYHFSGNALNKGDAFSLTDAVNAKRYEENWFVPAPGAILPAPELVEQDPAFRDINYFSELEENLVASRALVDVSGERFTNEAGNTTQVLADMVDKAPEGVYLVFDDSNPELNELFDQYVDGENLYKVEDLENSNEFPELKDTLETNSAVAQATQEDLFGKSTGDIKDYEGEVFYLVKVSPNIVATMGGIVTDENQQVLNEDDEPIEGLFAVGEVTHHFLYNRAQFANVSNNASISMGRIVAEYLMSGK